MVEHDETEGSALIEQLKLLLLSSPYLIDFLCGIITLKLFISMLKDSDESQVVPQNKSNEQLLGVYSRNNDATT